MVNYASPGSRIVAIIIDYIILWVISIIIALPFGISAAMLSMFSNTSNFASFIISPMFWGPVMIINAIIWVLYFTYFEGNSGQTVGKRIMNIKVVKKNGKKITYADALIRTVLRVVDGIAFYILGLIVILVSEHKQRIGDIAANTIVVKA